MTKKRFACLTAVVALLAGGMIAHGWRPAEAGVPGPTECPSDVDNDGNVGVLDFLQVLAEWGPCPTPPKPIAVALSPGTPQLLARQWSDGMLEVFIPLYGGPQMGVVAPASAHVGAVVDITVNSLGGNSGCGIDCASQGFDFPLPGGLVVVRQYADGYAEWTTVSMCENTDDPHAGHCFNWASPAGGFEAWSEVPPPP